MWETKLGESLIRNFLQKWVKFCSMVVGELLLLLLCKRVRIWGTHGEGLRFLGCVMRSERSVKG